MFAACAALGHGIAQARPVAVLKSKSIVAYDRALAGLRATFQEEVHTFDLDGRLENGPEITKKILLLQPGVVITIGARAAQVARAAGFGVPIVYCLVLHPARFNLETTGFHGVPLWVPASQQLAALRRILPRLRRIGLIGNPRKTPQQVEDIRRAARAARVSVAMTRIGDAKDVPAALEQILPRVDALWLLPDASVLNDESFRYLLLQAFRRGIAVLAFARSFVRAGALLALSPDYRSMGSAAAELAKKVLEGEAPRTAAAPPAHLTINATTARRLNIAIPADLMRSAEIVE